MWWQKVFPKYGNWGGPGWSGGCYPSSPKETDWSIQPIDAMDLIFRNHDRRYQNAIKRYPEREDLQKEVFKKADEDLIRLLKSLEFDPNLWILKPPKNLWYAKYYRICAIYVFEIRGLLCH